MKKFNRCILIAIVTIIKDLTNYMCNLCTSSIIYVRDGHIFSHIQTIIQHYHTYNPVIHHTNRIKSTLKSAPKGSNILKPQDPFSNKSSNF